MVSEKVKNPSRVQVVTASIHRAAISASALVAVDCLERRPATSLLLTVDLRTNVVPPFPSTLAGNVILFFVASSTAAETETEVWSMVEEMKRKTEFTNKWRSKYKGAEAGTVEWESLYW
ncbi:uncharacterized protein LOC111013300 [Momordica charantia]|uniref:Uncharacterized protein LOC111013300 n=1 Tax=Momordica charantia TaxID=3673 RepID=A0A6J1CP91_MOMCH|nr:uncharacterized protein LOC111013300 [Momordica charantia]